MILYPAIDLKDGQCVRLRLGDMEQSTIFNDDPAAQARDFAEAGCEWLHLVDLNGAFAGKPVNAEAVEEILAAVDVPVQLGGGIREMAMIDAWLEQRGLRCSISTSARRKRPLSADTIRLDSFAGVKIHTMRVSEATGLPVTTSTRFWTRRRPNDPVPGHRPQGR